MRNRASEQIEIPFGVTPAAEATPLPERVLRATRELLELARDRWPEAVLPEPRIEFRLRGRSAGEACGRTWTTNYNRDLLERYGEDFIREIVPHEVAHLVAPRVFGRRVKPHGREWKAVMAFFGVPARVSHEFEAPPVPHLGRFAYRCACRRRHWLTRRAHLRVRRGSHEYSCTACGETLVYVG